MTSQDPVALITVVLPASSASPQVQATQAALREAVLAALERKRRLGQYAVVWQDGRPQAVEPAALLAAAEQQPPAAS